MTIKDAEETDLRPLDLQVLLALGLENVEDDGDPIFIVVSDDALVCIGCIRLDHSAFLLGRLRGLMVLQK